MFNDALKEQEKNVDNAISKLQGISQQIGYTTNDEVEGMLELLNETIANAQNYLKEFETAKMQHYEGKIKKKDMIKPKENAIATINKINYLSQRLLGMSIYIG